MSANKSELSNAKYGYDFVVATTQESINGTMKEYLYNSTFPVVKMYWNQDATGDPVAVSRDDLLKQTNGTDPLTVPSWNKGDPMTPAITNINNSNFYFAFEAAIGIPSGIAPQDIPDIITLQAASSVTFNLICAQFTVVTCHFDRHGFTSFFSASQPTNTPWIFTSIVALKQIFDNSNLPPAVQAQLNNLGPDAFSVQQLFFDLDNAALESTPTISGIASGTPAYTLLTTVFLGAYFKAMQTNKQPILNYSIVQNTPDNDPSTLKLTKMELEVSPYTPAGASTNDLNTLCYLCETNGNNLLPAVPFTWNWVEQSEESSFDGVISINRNTFAKYFEDQLTSYVSQNCFAAWVRVSISGFFDQNIHYYWSMTANQTPTITTPATGATVLNYSYSSTAEDDAGAGGDMGEMKLSTTYTASVTFTGATIVVSQQLLVYAHVQRYQSGEGWNAINKTITDTYTLAMDGKGGLTAGLVSVPVDNSEPTPSTNWFIKQFTGLNELVNDVASWASGFDETSFQSMPLNVAQQFIFPGGKTFTFKDVSFSDSQDLVSHISYVQPNQ
ncbi:hypothetical protein [Nitrosomonas sp.]|uniref:hypothetical protein n=1 Tax=Nitrosomonas sp. TaxID=42353 RepID=UPI0025CD03FC|nr:hypothetical protein [Nitrosomonas sp.]